MRKANVMGVAAMLLMVGLLASVPAVGAEESVIGMPITAVMEKGGVVYFLELAISENGQFDVLKSVGVPTEYVDGGLKEGEWYVVNPGNIIDVSRLPDFGLRYDDLPDDVDTIASGGGAIWIPPKDLYVWNADDLAVQTNAETIHVCIHYYYWVGIRYDYGVLTVWYEDWETSIYTCIIRPDGYVESWIGR